MFKDELEHVHARIAAACERSGRPTSDVTLILVTKWVESERINQVYQLGQRDFGENRVQELDRKRHELPEDIRWHFIGHLQTNKVKSVVGEVALLHSCDRLDLAKTLQKQAEKKNTTIELLMQVNTSGEASKYGFSSKEAQAAVSELICYDRLKVRGLMTIGPFTENKEQIRTSFRALRQLRDRLQDEYTQVDWHTLSMGMSSDFEIAIEEGSNFVRVGTAVFGRRKEVKN